MMVIIFIIIEFRSGMIFYNRFVYLKNEKIQEISKEKAKLLNLNECIQVREINTYKPSFQSL